MKKLFATLWLSIVSGAAGATAILMYGHVSHKQFFLAVGGIIAVLITGWALLEIDKR